MEVTGGSPASVARDTRRAVPRLAPAYWIVVAVYGAVVVAIGAWANRRQKTTEDYFLGGRRMRWWAVGISLIATSFSSVALIGGTGYGFVKGMGYLQLQIGDLAAILVACALFLSFFARLRLTPAYEYLERRFGVGARTVASLLFIGQTLLCTGVLVLRPALALLAVTDLDLDLAIVVVGVLVSLVMALVHESPSGESGPYAARARASPRPARGGRGRGGGNHDPRSTCSGGVVDGTHVVGSVCGEAGQIAVDCGDQIQCCRRVVGMRFGQLLRHDHARPVDAQVKLAPAPFPTSAVLDRGPLPFAEGREATAVHYQMKRVPPHLPPKMDVEVSPVAREGRVIGGFEIKVHEVEDRSQESLGLAERQVEDEAERERRLDRQIRELVLDAAVARRLRAPGRDGLRSEPESDVAAPHEGAVVRGAAEISGSHPPAPTVITGASCFRPDSTRENMNCRKAKVSFESASRSSIQNRVPRKHVET